jgi:tRNA U34 5-methylaminomethyl-2-thiouridine-forming methyltransferase MnmC
LKREVIETADGSKTLQIREWNEQYHSKHGAIQEAYHVFIENGLRLFQNQKLHILEIGFGTGLNAIITFLESKKNQLNIYYKGVEAFPISLEEAGALNYLSSLDAEEYVEAYELMHRADWNKNVTVAPHFTLHKDKADFRDITDKSLFNLIYFDAFGARVQPELWTVSIFQSMYEALMPGGVLVTYAAKGSVRRAMLEVGFTVERLPGPPGKREMLRATK